MIAADTSVVVAAFASWHERHDAANKALVSGTRLIAHCAIEAYSVLTRLPPPHRAGPDIVRDYLNARFPEDYLAIGAAELRSFLNGLPELGISGGTAYDAMVGSTAAIAGATLISLDRRAARTYERCGVEVSLLG